MYGWYGDYYLGRENNGELLASRRPPSIEYISARSLINIKLADVNLTFNATFIVPEIPTIRGAEDENKTIILEILLGFLVIIIVALTFVSAYFYKGAKNERKKSKKYVSLVYILLKVYLMLAT